MTISNSFAPKIQEYREFLNVATKWHQSIFWGPQHKTTGQEITIFCITIF